MLHLKNKNVLSLLCYNSIHKLDHYNREISNSELNISIYGLYLYKIFATHRLYLYKGTNFLQLKEFES